MLWKSLRQISTTQSEVLEIRVDRCMDPLGRDLPKASNCARSAQV